MKVFLKNIFSFSISSLVLHVLLFLHPTTLLAMDPKTEEEVTEEIVGGVEKYCKYSINPSVECAPANHPHSSNSACSTSSPLPSSISYLPSPTAAAVPTAYSLQPIASIRPAGRLGDYILSLPAEMIAQFLRSPEPKQAAYKAEHEQTVQELQAQYPCLTCPELAQKIVDWKRAVERWSECRFPEEQEACYQNVVALASEMPSELYRLVALSQAMKIMENAKAYSYYLPRAFEQYDKDTETEEARTMATRSKIILLAQIDAINNNIEKLEKAAEAILTLAEQRHRCLAAADAARRAAIDEATIPFMLKVHNDSAKMFEEVVEMDKKAITNYCQFSQKMREGDVPVASKFRMKGFYLECDALQTVYFIQSYQAEASEDSTKANNYSTASKRARHAAITLCREAVGARSEKQIEAAKAYEQAIYYCLQVAQACADGDSVKEKNFSLAVIKTKFAARSFSNASVVKKRGEIEIAKSYEKEALYHLRRAELYAQEGKEKGDAFLREIYDEELRQREGVNQRKKI